MDLNVRAVLDFENLMADQVVFFLNGAPAVEMPRLNTDWYTYMQSDLHHGFSESPAPQEPEILWTAAVCGTIHEFPNPVVVDGIVYYPSDIGTDSLYALDVLTGETIWKYLVGTTDDAVTVKDGLLYIASDSLWCLDALTGERVWASGMADGSGSTPAAIGADLFAGKLWGWNRSSFSCFDALTGAIRWSSFLPEGVMVSCPTVWEGLVFVPTSGGPIYAFDCVSGGIVWTNWDSGDGYWDSSPVIVDGILYIGGSDGYLRAIDATAGQTFWATFVNDSGSAITATPAFHGGHLFIGADNGPFVCVDASSGQILWSVDLTIHGSPCVADGLVCFGEYSNPSQETSRVIALDCDTGDFAWTYTVQANRFQSTPAVTDGVLYIAAIDGFLYAFGTGLKYSYDAPFTAQVGWNELIVEAYCQGGAVFSDSVSFLVDPYGIEEESPNPPSVPELRILQNPVDTSAMLVLVSSSQDPTGIEVFDLSGRNVASSEIPAGLKQQMELDVSGFPAGIYAIRWMQDGTTGVARLVVLR